MMIHQKKVKMILTVKEIFSLLFMRAVSVNPDKSYCLVKIRNQMFITATGSLRNQNYFRNKKVTMIKKFSGKLLSGVTVSNPLQNHIICPVILNDNDHKYNSSGLSPVCPLLYQDDLHLSAKYPIDRKSIFDKFGKMKFQLHQNISLGGNHNNQQKPS